MLNPSTEWSTSDVPSGDRTDAWQSVLSTSYREWQVPHRLPATFYAHVKQHDFAGAGIVETVCDPARDSARADRFATMMNFMSECNSRRAGVSGSRLAIQAWRSHPAMSSSGRPIR